MPYHEEWAAVEAKLELLASDAEKPHDQSERLRQRLEDIGGGDFLAYLQSVHVEYGRALGITVHRQAAESPLVQEKKRALEGLLREYITHLSGLTTRYSADDQKALVATLLAPYAEAKAESRAARSRSAQPASDPGTSKPPDDAASTP